MRVPVVERRRVHVDGREVRVGARGGQHRRHHVRNPGGHLAEPVGVHPTDPQRPGHRAAGAAHRAPDGRGVGDRARDRPAAIEPRREGHDPAHRHAPARGANPTTPQSAAGMRTDPADSPLDPPGVRAGSQGLRQCGVRVPKANGGLRVLPSTTTPAARSLATTSASVLATAPVASDGPARSREAPRSGGRNITGSVRYRTVGWLPCRRIPLSTEVWSGPGAAAPPCVVCTRTHRREGR